MTRWHCPFCNDSHLDFEVQCPVTLRSRPDHELKIPKPVCPRCGRDNGLSFETCKSTVICICGWSQIVDGKKADDDRSSTRH